MSQILQKFPLAKLTSFQVGGPAESYLRLNSASELKQLITQPETVKPRWFLGAGSNVLISDAGLPGLTWHFQGGRIEYRKADNLLIADSGVIWDDLVISALKKHLWGIELMSGIPGSVGGAVAININAYGQALSDCLCWIEVYDPDRAELYKVNYQPADWSYKQSPFAESKLSIVRAALKLSCKPTVELRYAKALQYAREQNLDPRQLTARRRIIIGARAAAGSLLDDSPQGQAKSCGSFFRNPLVDAQQIEPLLAYEEGNLKKKELLEMNRLHGGQARRVSAAHVLLAAGFRRGQTFGRVRLHPNHVLKIENWRNASAQEIYDVAQTIQAAVMQKLAIKLEFEVKTLGKFQSPQGLEISELPTPHLKNS